MELKDILEWQQKDTDNRSYVLRGEQTSNFRPKFLNSVFLFNATKSEEEKSVIFPQSMMDEIKPELLDDFKAIKKIVDDHENDGKKVVSSWLYASKKSKCTLKGHYMSLTLAGLPEIGKIIKGQPFEQYFVDRIKQFEEDIKYLSLDDINNNNMEYYDRFYDDMKKLYDDLRNHLIEKYNYREGH
jgi:hypothetical protein